VSPFLASFSGTPGLLPPPPVITSLPGVSASVCSVICLLPWTRLGLQPGLTSPEHCTGCIKLSPYRAGRDLRSHWFNASQLRSPPCFLQLHYSVFSGFPEVRPDASLGSAYWHLPLAP
jgi:hypothetical protein